MYLAHRPEASGRKEEIRGILESVRGLCARLQYRYLFIQL